MRRTASNLLLFNLMLSKYLKTLFILCASILVLLLIFVAIRYPIYSAEKKAIARLGQTGTEVFCRFSNDFRLVSDPEGLENYYTFLRHSTIEYYEIIFRLPDALNKWAKNKQLSASELSTIIPKLKGIKKISVFCDYAFNDEFVEAFPVMPNLEELFVEDFQLSEKGVSLLINRFPNLRRITAGSASITEEARHRLETMPELRLLQFNSIRDEDNPKDNKG